MKPKCLCIETYICFSCQEKRQLKQIDPELVLKVKAFKEADRNQIMNELEFLQFGRLFMELKDTEVYLFDEWFAKYAINFYESEERRKEKELQEIKDTLNIKGSQSAQA